MKILVTGGAGYIGSFMVKRLLEEGHQVVVVDSLERGHQDAIPNEATFIKGDLKDNDFIANLFKSDSYEGIIHFAAYISMGESMEKPSLYFRNNTIGSLNLIDAAVSAKVKYFIFSSTAGVYGNPIKIPILEDHPKNPTNPYGESKLFTELMLDWYSKSSGLNTVALRYFNACGASLDRKNGERHLPETHLIPSAIMSLLKNKEFYLFGTDYKTKDGTPVRDYIHVLDLVEAHLLALKYLDHNKGMHYFNVGTGIGYTNRQVIDEIERITGKKLNLIEGSRRPGDADILIADVEKIKKELNFVPKYSDLKEIIKTAWDWHSSRI